MDDLEKQARWAKFNYTEIRYLAWSVARAPRLPTAGFEIQWLQAELLTELLNRTTPEA